MESPISEDTAFQERGREREREREREPHWHALRELLLSGLKQEWLVQGWGLEECRF